MYHLSFIWHLAIIWPFFGTFLVATSIPIGDFDLSRPSISSPRLGAAEPGTGAPCVLISRTTHQDGYMAIIWVGIIWVCDSIEYIGLDHPVFIMEFQGLQSCPWTIRNDEASEIAIERNIPLVPCLFKLQRPIF